MSKIRLVSKKYPRKECWYAAGEGLALVRRNLMLWQTGRSEGHAAQRKITVLPTLTKLTLINMLFLECFQLSMTKTLLNFAENVILTEL